MPIDVKRTIERRTPDTDACFHRTLNIKIERGSKCLQIWVAGKRTRYNVRFQDIYRFASIAYARQMLAEARSRKKARKGK